MYDSRGVGACDIEDEEEVVDTRGDDDKGVWVIISMYPGRCSYNISSRLYI